MYRLDKPGTGNTHSPQKMFGVLKSYLLSE